MKVRDGVGKSHNFLLIIRSNMYIFFNYQSAIMMINSIVNINNNNRLIMIKYNSILFNMRVDNILVFNKCINWLNFVVCYFGVGI